MALDDYLIECERVENGEIVWTGMHGGKVIAVSVYLVTRMFEMSEEGCFFPYYLQLAEDRPDRKNGLVFLRIIEIPDYIKD